MYKPKRVAFNAQVGGCRGRLGQAAVYPDDRTEMTLREPRLVTVAKHVRT